MSTRDPATADEHGHWDVADIRALLTYRDTLRAELGQWKLGSATVNERLLTEIERLRAKLQEIAGTDYRGNRSTESQLAWRALQEGGK